MALLCCLPASSWGQQVTEVSTRVLPIHSHNDYWRARPLWDALQAGALSIEADIFLQSDGSLLVGHEPSELSPERSLESLYLQPLQQLCQRQGGYVYSDRVLLLMVDVKTSAEKTYPVLHALLQRYAPMLSRVEDGKMIQGAVQVVISGGRPMEQLPVQSTRYAALDGRPHDASADAQLYPMVSDSWSSHFSWTGEGEMPASERKKLKAMASKYARNGHWLRFWGVPQAGQQAIYTQLRRYPCILLGGDDLPLLASWIK